MKNKSIYIIIITILAITIGGVSFWLWNKNQEVITDLGNGWSSYYNKNIGVTVKIPSDAEIKKEREYEFFTYSVDFSNGPIRALSNIGSLMNDDTFSYEDNLQKYRKEILKKNNKWSEIEKKARFQSRSIYKQMQLDKKTVFLEFVENENIKTKENTFYLYGLRVPGEKGFYNILFHERGGYDGSNLPKELYNTYPQIQKSQSHEEYINEAEKAVRDLIISINEDNF